MDSTLRTWDQILQILKLNLNIAQERMKKNADLKKKEQTFNIRDWEFFFFLNLKAYFQWKIDVENNIYIIANNWEQTKIVLRQTNIAVQSLQSVAINRRIKLLQFYFIFSTVTFFLVNSLAPQQS